MVAFFRHSKSRYSYKTTVAGAVGAQTAGIALLAIFFHSLGGYFGKPTHPWEHLATCFLGVVTSFFFIALIPPLTGRRLGFIAIGSIGFAFFYWFASLSLPDVWLAQTFAGAGIGILTAAAYRWVFLEAPILPRVP